MEKMYSLSDDKVRLTTIAKGQVSVLYEDISSLSTIPNPGKILLLLGGIFTGLFALVFLYSSYSDDTDKLFLGILGVLFLFITIWLYTKHKKTPKQFLVVETRGGSKYNLLLDDNDFNVIDEIENKRRNVVKR